VKKVYKENQLLEVNNMPIEVIESIKVTIDILNENYGVNRAIESDLGGYVVIAENIVDIEVLKQDKLQGLVPEYTDVIEVVNRENYTSSLYLLSSDFSIVVVTTEELSKLLLE
jgi:galactitol-specific phosphotransferase system IIB component